jgi:hypothetical protein
LVNNLEIWKRVVSCGSKQTNMIYFILGAAIYVTLVILLINAWSKAPFMDDEDLDY